MGAPRRIEKERRKRAERFRHPKGLPAMNTLTDTTCPQCGWPTDGAEGERCSECVRPDWMPPMEYRDLVHVDDAVADGREEDQW